MKFSLLWLLACLLLQGCIPRTVIVHDGLKTTVIDFMSKEPLEGAFVYDRLDGQAPHILALSDEKGEILLNPKKEFVLSSLLGEAKVFKHLWVCKEGYMPYLAGSMGGWNADFGSSKTHTPVVIELTRSSLAPSESCLDLQARW
ncbi:MAG: hypothetical protein KA748_02955 [Halomonas sp.]|nr:hypothetical protein [Halomonas sp.]MBP5979142.1 hypothetical protein [Halomonas sp.]